MATPPTSRGKPYQSKLLPYAVQIRQWRKGRVSYRQIAQRLSGECHCPVTASTVFSFVKVRSTRRKVVEMLDSEVSTGRRGVPANGTPLFHYEEDKPLTLKAKETK
jgi:hypothetical protein